MAEKTEVREQAEGGGTAEAKPQWYSMDLRNLKGGRLITGGATGPLAGGGKADGEEVSQGDKR